MKKRSHLFILLFAPIVLIIGATILGRFALRIRNASIEKDWSNRVFTAVGSYLDSGLQTQGVGQLTINDSREAELGLRAFLRMYKDGKLDRIKLGQSPSGLESDLLLNPTGVTLFSTIAGVNNQFTGGNFAGLEAVWQRMWELWPDARYQLIEQQGLIKITELDVTSIKYSKVNATTQTALAEQVVSLNTPNIIKYQSSFLLKLGPKGQNPERTNVYDVFLFIRSASDAYPVAVRFAYFKDFDKYIIMEILQGFVGPNPPPRRFIL